MLVSKVNSSSVVVSKSISGVTYHACSGDSSLLYAEICTYLFPLKLLDEYKVLPPFKFTLVQPASVISEVDVIFSKSSSNNTTFPPTAFSPHSKTGGSHLSVFVNSRSEGVFAIATRNSAL